MTISALLLLACSKPPTIDLVEPSTGPPEVAIQILGAEFTADTTAILGGEPLGDLVVQGVMSLQATVPSGLAPGPHDLVVTTPAGSVTQTGAYTVRVQDSADAGKPCAGVFTAYSQLSMARELMVIDKHFKKQPGEEEGRRVTVRLDFRDIARIEYEEVTVQVKGSDATCSAIWVVTKSGDRHLFDDDTQENLRNRANEIAVGIQKPIDVVTAD
jgi:hypothetical protein